MEWYEQGFWNIYPHPDTAKQYLQPRGETPDDTPKLNEWLMAYSDGNPQGKNRVYMCTDITGEGGFANRRVNKGITLEGFLALPFDIVIASIPQHIEPFKRLCELHPSKPKLIYQIGNEWNIPSDSGVKNIMASAKVKIPTDINYVEYHQEFDLNIFSPKVASEGKKIYSFINVLQEKPDDWQLFLNLERLMPSWEFKAFGGQCRDGVVVGDEAIANKMSEATFGFHCKTYGDGFGHIVHNWAALGRPVIVRKRDYNGKLASPLLTPETSIFVDNLGPEQIAFEIEQRYKDGSYKDMGFEMTKKFYQNVNYDQEELKIQTFLDRLQ